MIDCHIHFWLYTTKDFPWIKDNLAPIAKDMLYTDLAKVLPDRIEKIIVIQAQTNHNEINFLTNLAQQNQKIAGLIAWFDFADAPEHQIAQALNNNYIKGFRHLIQDEAEPRTYLLDNSGLARGVKAIQKAGFIYEVLVRQTDLPAAVKFCQAHNQYSLVIDHLAKPIIGDKAAFPQWKEAIVALKNLDHVHVKISGLVTEAGLHCAASDFQPYIDTLLEHIGPKRLVWGSDWPVCSASHNYQSLLDLWDIWSKNISKEEKELIESKNAIALYKI